MRSIKFLILILLLLFFSCAPFPQTFIRSDLFANPERINTIYVLPINIEISADEAKSKRVLDIRDNFNKYYLKISDEIRENLIDKGYKVSGISPSLKQLSKQDAGNIDLIKELMKSLRREHEAQYKFVYEKKETEITIIQKNPLFNTKTQAHLSLPLGTDAMLVVLIKTHIGKRSFLGMLSDKSTMKVTLELFDFKKAELAFKDNYEEKKSDLSEFSKAEETIKMSFSKLPIKI